MLLLSLWRTPVLLAAFLPSSPCRWLCCCCSRWQRRSSCHGVGGMHGLKVGKGLSSGAVPAEQIFPTVYAKDLRVDGFSKGIVGPGERVPRNGTAALVAYIDKARLQGTATTRPPKYSTLAGILLTAADACSTTAVVQRGWLNLIPGPEDFNWKTMTSIVNVSICTIEIEFFCVQ